VVERSYPVYEPATEWLINMVPPDKREIDPINAELKIIPRFSKKTMAEGFDWSVRSPRDALTINMHSKPRDLRSYVHLRKEFTAWLPLWMEHFSVEKINRVNLHYVNLLNSETLPTFIASSGVLPVDKVFKIFFPIPGSFKELIPPLQCQVTLKADVQTTLQILMVGIIGKQPAIRFDLVAARQFKAESDIEQIMVELDRAHHYIIDSFESFLTDEAKQSFGPIDQ
jgi:uncharacterized protein (TIGR04255 family)